MRIAIVGGGATGALAAMHLARVMRDRAFEVVVEPAEQIGPGVAYATSDPRHLLNVRASNMSAFPDQPDHLFRWLQREEDPTVVSSCFIPRGVYGTYLVSLMRDLIECGRVLHVRDRCVDLIEGKNKVQLALGSGNSIDADVVVLATGNEPKASLNGLSIVQPWAKGALNEIRDNGPILIIGTGLTMVDMALSLDRQGYRGKITAISPRGLLPSAHRAFKPFELATHEVPFGAEISQIMSWLRQLANRRNDWRSAIDALRPHIQDIWRSMSLVQRRRFLRHARGYWEVHRHRMAPQVERQIDELRARGRLRIVAGRIISVKRKIEGFEVGFALRGQNRVGIYKFAQLIDCTGFADNPALSSNPLIANLLSRGTARVDAVGIGLDVNEEYALIDASGRSSDRVLAVGPLARAAFWECTAIPDIRQQCSRLAQLIEASARST